MKIVKYLLLSLISIIGFTFSQTAPDFTVTDVEGNTHNCYEYLDGGKYIVLSFMVDG